MAVTQKEIAQKLNISRSLVARALKGYSEVSDETREKVRQVAAEMGYDPNTNQAARSLAARRYGQRADTGVIALMFPSSMNSSPRHMPFYVPFFEGMEEEAMALGMDVYMCWVRPGRLPHIIREGGVDGVVSVSNYEQELLEVQQLQIPLVAYQTTFNGAYSVLPDDRQGMYLATRHLLEQGHRRIAYLGCAIDEGCIASNGNPRLQGYLDALQEFGVTPHPELIETHLKFPLATELSYCQGCGKCAACTGWQVLKGKTAKNPMTAVVCHNDIIAMGVVDHARKDGVDVPRQLSVIGFDDVSQRYHFEPAITSVQFSRYEMGKCAVRIIHKARENDAGREKCLNHIFPVTLAEHGSTTTLSKKREEVMTMIP